MPNTVPRAALYACQECGSVTFFYGTNENFNCDHCKQPVGDEVSFEYRAVILLPDTEIGG